MFEIQDLSRLQELLGLSCGVRICLQEGIYPIRDFPLEISSTHHAVCESQCGIIDNGRMLCNKLH